MKALLITPKNSNEFKFISDLLKKLGVGASSVSEDQLEDTGFSKMLESVDKTKKECRSEIMRKLSA